MKVYLGIIAILVIVFIQSTKNYTNKAEFYSFRSVDSSITPDENASKKYTLKYSETDSNIHQEISKYINKGIEKIEAFFSEPYYHQFDVLI